MSDEPEVAYVDEPGRIRPFADTLRDLGKGQVIDEAAILLADLAQAVIAHGKKGSFTLSIEIAPLRGTTSQLSVSARAQSRPPKGDPIAAIFYADKTGNLLRHDPKQDPLIPLREVAQPDAHLRERA